MLRPLAVVTLAALVMACAKDDSAVDSTAAATASAATPAADAAAIPTTVEMKDAAGVGLGTLSLTETAGGISVSGMLHGIPVGTHAVHFHMVGQCQPPFETAGSHWNPTNKQHGSANPQGPHFGDMPNVTIGADGMFNVIATTSGGTLRGANPLLDADGAALVVHASPDDNRTDPSGNAGGRIACGVVR